MPKPLNQFRLSLLYHLLKSLHLHETNRNKSGHHKMNPNLVAVGKPKLLPIPVYFKENLKRFLIETSLNGLKYIEDVHRNIYER